MGQGSGSEGRETPCGVQLGCTGSASPQQVCTPALFAEDLPANMLWSESGQIHQHFGRVVSTADGIYLKSTLPHYQDEQSERLRTSNAGGGGWRVLRKGGFPGGCRGRCGQSLPGLGIRITGISESSSLPWKCSTPRRIRPACSVRRALLNPNPWVLKHHPRFQDTAVKGNSRPSQRTLDCWRKENRKFLCLKYSYFFINHC